MFKNLPEKGFAIISLILTLAIIIILVAVYYYGSGNNGSSAAQAGHKAIQQTGQNNKLLEDQNLEEQNQLNSIGN